MTYIHKDFADALAEFNDYLFESEREPRENEKIFMYALQALADPKWKLCPVEPTDNMLHSALHWTKENYKTLEWPGMLLLTKYYEAMLKEIPPYTQTPDDTGDKR